MENLKISFDYDGTLSESQVRAVAKKMVDIGADVYITTARPEYMGKTRFANEDLFATARALGIPRANIRFCNYDSKYKKLRGFDFHMDDNATEVNDINNASDCIALLYRKNTVRRLL